MERDAASAVSRRVCEPRGDGVPWIVSIDVNELRDAVTANSPDVSRCFLVSKVVEKRVGEVQHTALSTQKRRCLDPATDRSKVMKCIHVLGLQVNEAMKALIISELARA